MTWGKVIVLAAAIIIGANILANGGMFKIVPLPSQVGVLYVRINTLTGKTSYCSVNSCGPVLTLGKDGKYVEEQ